MQLLLCKLQGKKIYMIATNKRYKNVTKKIISEHSSDESSKVANINAKRIYQL